MHVNNETGIIQPVYEIGNFLKNTNVIFHIDAAQACGKLINEIKNINYDLMSITAHKMYGPQDVGALIYSQKKIDSSTLTPIMHGGNQEYGFRPGTLSTSLIVGFAKACEIAEKEYQSNNLIYENNKKMILRIINKLDLKHTINGNPDFCLPNTLNISFLNVDSNLLMKSARDVCSFSTGSACNANDSAYSHVLKAMGLSDDRIKSAIRLSWGNQPLDKEKLIQFAKIIKEMQSKA